MQAPNFSTSQMMFFNSRYKARLNPVHFLLGSPSAPLNLTNSLVREQQPPFDVWVTWSVPEENGGSTVLHYQLECKIASSSWIDATVLKTNNTYMLISNNGKAYIYEVRVTARNKFGFGAASKSCYCRFRRYPLNKLTTCLSVCGSQVKNRT